MKRRILALISCIVMMSVVVGGCSSSSTDDSSATSEASESSEASETSEAAEAEEETSDGDDESTASLNIGISIQSLSNEYWAGVMTVLQELMDEKGYTYTLIDCDDNSATQVSQVENFITMGVDVIMVHPSDPDALEDICAEALAAGIEVMCWDDEMENTTANWVLDNTELGVEIGKAAASFINEYYTSDDPAEVCIIGYPSTPVLLNRANGIKQGLEEYCEDNYTIVAEVEGIVASDAQTNVETALQANPDCTVFVGVGSGAMIGANEALLQYYGGAGNIPENVGVITTDVTTQQLESLQAGDEAVRAIIGFEGSNTDTAQACLEMIEAVAGIDGEYSGDKNVYRPLMEINLDNIEEIMAGM